MCLQASLVWVVLELSLLLMESTRPAHAHHITSSTNQTLIPPDTPSRPCRSAVLSPPYYLPPTPILTSSSGASSPPNSMTVPKKAA